MTKSPFKSPVLIDLVETVRQTQALPDKLVLVNQFINTRIQYGSDQMVWHCKEYWATPDELMAKGIGDCEDYAIAKYFILRESGLEDCLKIVYGRLRTTNEAHMVLLCPEDLVLDNYVEYVFTLTPQSNFLPILGFNHDGLWSFPKGKAHFVTTDSKRLIQWKRLLKRMEDE